MSETLVIRLRAHEDAPASWLLVDSNGARSGPVQSGPVADALALAADRRVVLLLPGAEITLAEPELPMRAGSKLAQAVPFALEEQLASEVEGLHFALGTRQPSAVGTPVATVARALMDRWIGVVEAAGIHPNAAYSDATAIPSAPNACTLLLDEGMLYVRRADALPYVLDAQPLNAALSLALGPTEATEGEMPPAKEHVTFYASAQEYEAQRDTIEGLRSATETLQVKLLPEGPLPLLAANALAAPSVNLLQGSYGTNVGLVSRLRAWRLPAALAAGLLLVFFVAQGMQLWQLSREAKRLDGQIAQLVAQLLPGQPVVDARAQIQGVLGNSSGGGASALLPTLSALAYAMAQAPQGRVEALSYRGDAMDLRVVAPSVEVLDGIKQTMASRGMTVELQSATPRGDVVEGRLQVKVGAA
jgi:general secretion pathway protein L